MTSRSGRIGVAVLFATVASVFLHSEALAQQGPFLPAATVNATLDSLERVALSSKDPAQRRSAVLRISAYGWLTMEARRGTTPIEVRYPGVVDRLARIYHEIDGYWMRSAIIPMMMPQAERVEAASFLEQVAQEPEDRPAPLPVVVVDDNWPLQSLAVGALPYIGVEGEAALRRLYAAGTVTEATARAELEQFAKRGFRQRP
jgi:hypothetical protein